MEDFDETLDDIKDTIWKWRNDLSNDMSKYATGKIVAYDEVLELLEYYYPS